MAVAIIEATITRPSGGPPGPFTGVSSNDLWVSDTVTCVSVSTGVTPSTTYAWSIAYQPHGSTASFTGDPTTAAPGDFTITHGGPYLIRLVLDQGLPTENEQFIRLRVKVTLDTEDLLLVAAGEQYGGAATPIPVDIDPVGWTDEQNNNLLALLNLIKPSYTSGHVLYVDGSGGGDYTTIQAAIDYAVTQGPTAMEPWVVLVRPGTYDESLVLQPSVHVFGWPGSDSSSPSNIVRIRNEALSGHVLTTTLSDQRVLLHNLNFLQQHPGTFPAITVTGGGGVSSYRCTFDVQGIDAAQGPAFSHNSGGTGSSEFVDCRFVMNSGAGVDCYLLGGVGPTLRVRECFFQGRSGAVVGGSDGVLDIADSTMILDGTFGARIQDVGQALIAYSRISGAVESVDVNPGGAGGTSPPVGTTLQVRWSILDSTITFRTAAIVGTTVFGIGSTEHGAISFPDGLPTSSVALTPSDTLAYDPTLLPSAPDITATDVQNALDQIYNYASQVRTLDDAYDGGLGAGGSGRTIVADAGAVQIVDAATPSPSPVPGSTQGSLQVTGTVEVGGVGKPEINLNPNPFGIGAEITMGWQIWPGDALYGSTTFLRAASIDANPWRNYNLFVGTSPSDGGDRIGKVIIAGGQGLEGSKVTPPHAGDVYILGGDTSEPVAVTDAGSVFIGPGGSITGSAGSIFFGRPETATAATLTAAAPCVDPLVTGGDITFGTEAGGFTVSFAPGDNFATVLGRFNSTGRVTATDAGGGVIQLTTTTKGPITDIFWASSDGGGGAGIDLELGGFEGQAPVGGAWVDHMEIRVTDHNEITFGPLPGPAIGPMIYNADTGKLTVPGLIDPTGIIFDNAPVPPTGPAKGGIFVSDGTDPGAPLINNPYYVDEAGVITDLLGGGPGGLPVPDDEGQILFAATPAAFVKATPLVDADGYLVTNGDGHMVVT